MDWKRAGAAIRRDRIRLYGSRATFAAAAGVSASVLFDLEQAVRSNFDVDTLGRVEDALGWAPGTIHSVANGGRVRRADPDLVAIQQAWPRLPREARKMLADLARLSAERQPKP